MLTGTGKNDLRRGERLRAAHIVRYPRSKKCRHSRRALRVSAMRGKGTQKASTNADSARCTEHQSCTASWLRPPGSPSLARTACALAGDDKCFVAGTKIRMV